MSSAIDDCRMEFIFVQCDALVLKITNECNEEQCALKHSKLIERKVSIACLLKHTTEKESKRMHRFRFSIHA